MILQLGDDGVVSEVNEDDLIYVDKNELDAFVEEYNHLKEEKEQQQKSFDGLQKENKDLREQLILANAFIKMIENCYEDANIEDILYMKYGEFQEELHLQMAIAKEELEK